MSQSSGPAQLLPVWIILSCCAVGNNLSCLNDTEETWLHQTQTPGFLGLGFGSGHGIDVK